MAAIYVLVSLWVREGQESGFESYERKVSRIMARHGGAIERVIRRSSRASDQVDEPFEVHVLRFASREQYDAFRSDPDRGALAAERAGLITRTEVMVGTEGPTYAD